MFSRWKIVSKVRRTDVVPAPEEPVMEIIGCATDMSAPEEAASAEERRALADRVRFKMVAIEPRDFFARSEQQWDSLMQRTRLYVENTLVARRGCATGLFDQPRNWIC